MNIEMINFLRIQKQNQNLDVTIDAQMWIIAFFINGGRQFYCFYLISTPNPYKNPTL